jgi:hypothetical protein
MGLPVAGMASALRLRSMSGAHTVSRKRLIAPAIIETVIVDSGEPQSEAIAAITLVQNAAGKSDAKAKPASLANTLRASPLWVVSICSEMTAVVAVRIRSPISYLEAIRIGYDEGPREQASGALSITGKQAR